MLLDQDTPGRLQETDQLGLLPEQLVANSLFRLQRLIEARADHPALELDASQLAQLLRAISCSEFITTQLSRDPALLDFLVSAAGQEPLQTESLAAELAGILAACADEASLMTQLRRFRHRIMTAIAWRDINGLTDANRTMADLSRAAEILISGTLDHLYAIQVREAGLPVDSTGKSQQLMVMAMGKLGAGELNFSSDVDLIFVYGEDGETHDGPRPLSNAQFFIRLGQQLIKVLHQVTADGFVYRVDMRLRPFGDTGPLAISLEALESYLHAHGREWERYAMIKARVISGDAEDRQYLNDVLRPFCFRRYLDYSVFRGLREMKRMILQEVKRKSLEHNIKLGAGGIREIEFIGQAFQLIRGGREPRLQIRPIQQVLQVLSQLNLLPDYVTRELTEAYLFLRNTEHRLQEVNDQQTHNLPRDATEQLRLAFAMGFADWPAFHRKLSQHQMRVRSHFEQMIASTPGEGGDEQDQVWLALWHQRMDRAQAIEELEKLGFTDSEATLDTLHKLYQSRYLKLSNEGRERLDTLIPFMILAAANTVSPGQTLQRTLQLVEAVARRTAYLALLSENSIALSQLVKLCAGSPWIAQLITQHPLLLDELLDPRTLYKPPFRDDLARELAQRLEAIAPEDLEQQMDALRQFKQANVLRVAAADIMEALPLMVVSDHLTWLAEIILQQALKLAWQDISRRHGFPPGKTTLDNLGFVILAYGKLGGIELGYGSDLDLVFLYYPADANDMTDGPRPLPVQVFFTRLGQRLIHILNTYTHSGILYEVDTRLRPSGASGMLVSNIDGFFDYQRNKAWTWEHQALVRARVITGDPALTTDFQGGRKEILCRQRATEALQQDVRDMREKMRTSLDKSNAENFDLKQGAGGIADIEFMVQYAVLAWARDYPDLTDYTDNIRILECLGKNGLLSAQDANLLCDAYRFYRDKVHKLTLQDQDALIPCEEVADYTRKVKELWQALLGN